MAEAGVRAFGAAMGRLAIGRMLMQKVELDRFQTSGILGAGADYEVRAAVDQETGKQVVLKRPVPQMISRGMHTSTEARTDRTLQVLEQMGQTTDHVVPIVGYTERGVHDQFYGDSLGQEYRVIVEERARGIPLMVGDMRARITGVPIGVGQNLFALHPLVRPPDRAPFAIHQQLLDLEESFIQGGYILLDLRPQNLFYQPSTGHITVVDCGDLVSVGDGPDRRGRPPRDVHDFCLEVLKFYATPKTPPQDAAAYRDPHGQRPVVDFLQELDEMDADFSGTDEPVRSAALDMIARIRDRAYTDFDSFRQDLNSYLAAVGERDQALAGLDQLRLAWGEALNWLREDHWNKYLFDAEVDLAAFDL